MMRTDSSSGASKTATDESGREAATDDCTATVITMYLIPIL